MMKLFSRSKQVLSVTGILCVEMIQNPILSEVDYLQSFNTRTGEFAYQAQILGISLVEEVTFLDIIILYLKT